MSKNSGEGGRKSTLQDAHEGLGQADETGMLGCLSAASSFLISRTASKGTRSAARIRLE